MPVLSIPHHIKASPRDSWLSPCLFPNVKDSTAQPHCQAGFTERGGWKSIEERLWEVQLKVDAAFRHHTLRGCGWALSTSFLQPAGQGGASFPSSNEGRQTEVRAGQNHSRSGYGCTMLDASGPQGGWLSSTLLYPGSPSQKNWCSLQKILCSPHASDCLALWGLWTGLFSL